jgi:hypothetical protein
LKGLAAILLGFLVLATLPLTHADPIPAMPPPAPIGLKASFNNTTQALVLDWTPYPSVTFNVYRNGDLLATQASPSYADTTYGTFNLYWITAQNENGTSRPSEPVGYIACTNPVDCAPDAGPQAAAWSTYSMVSIESGLVICKIASVQLTPFGYVIYWDCIWGIIHRFIPIKQVCAFQIYGGPPPIGPGQWCI